MKANILKLIIPSVALLIWGCTDEADKTPSFGTDIESIQLTADGGTETLTIYADGEWIADAGQPWVLVSPANGARTAECKITIDPSVTYEPRETTVTFRSAGRSQVVKVTQFGYGPAVIVSEVKQREIEIADYADRDKMNFYVDVQYNVPFKLEFVGEEILEAKALELDESNASRPQKTQVRFEWYTNVDTVAKSAKVRFLPDPAKLPAGIELAQVTTDSISVKQSAAPIIKPGRQGDSLVLTTLARVMNFDQAFPTDRAMDYWEEDFGIVLNDQGRVVKATLRNFYAYDLFPYHIQYMDELEELTVWGAYVSRTRATELNGYLAMLPKLKKIRINACPIITIDPAIGTMIQLESLDLAQNSLQEIPSWLTPENFPNLKELRLNTNYVMGHYDLSNADVDWDKIGLNGELPQQLLKWDALEILTLGVNTFYGTIPDFEDDPDVPKYTTAEAIELGIPELDGTPKVLPDCTLFTLNLNKLKGELPRWILYHPHLCKWIPDTFIFIQDGIDQFGDRVGFSNLPAQLDCTDEEIQWNKDIR